ncbi:MAG: hypothetical protein Q8906_10280, partial [Bacillota bacterium]|nr:hypothetical protein [Bacillota bacterium]
MKILKFFLCMSIMLACNLYVPNYKIYEAFGDQLQLKRQAKGLQHYQKKNSTLISQKEKEPDHDEEKITKKAITMVKTK